MFRHLLLLPLIFLNSLAWGAAKPQQPIETLSKPGFRTLLLDDGTSIRQVIPLRNMQNEQVRRVAQITMKLMAEKLESLHQRGLLPSEISVDALKNLDASSREIDHMIEKIKDSDINRVARDYGVNLKDLIPGAIFVGFGVSGNFPPPFDKILEKFKASRGSLTLGVIGVPLLVQKIDKFCTAENPIPKVEEYLDYDLSVVVIPNVNLKNYGIEEQSPVKTWTYRPTVGLIWGPNVTGDIYTASQLVGPSVNFGGHANISGLSSFLKVLPSTFLNAMPTGLNGKVGAITNSQGIFPTFFFGPEWGGAEVAAQSHFSASYIVSLSNFIRAAQGLLTPTELVAIGNLDQHYKIRWEPASRLTNSKAVDMDEPNHEAEKTEFPSSGQANTTRP